MPRIEYCNPGSHATAPARCGFLEVPENPAEPDGRSINLHIAIAEATSTSKEPDPVFFFAGGPGQASTETWVMIRPVLNKIRKLRDILMIDQRGTGQSNKLDCAVEDSDVLNSEIDFELLVTETKKCLAPAASDSACSCEFRP